ncbi:MAG: hypothetical protein WC242_02085 [Candidatus Paceibacterota bacterium]|jgi:hypothetical protein
MTDEAERIDLKPARCVKVYLKSDQERVNPLFLLIFECPEGRGIQGGLLRGPLGLGWSLFHGGTKKWTWVNEKDLHEEDAHLIEYPLQGVFVPNSLLFFLVLLTLCYKTPEEIAMLCRVPALKASNRLLID